MIARPPGSVSAANKRTDDQDQPISMADIVIACIVTACIGMAYIGMAYKVTAYIVMAYIVMAYLNTARTSSQSEGPDWPTTQSQSQGLHSYRLCSCDHRTTGLAVAGPGMRYGILVIAY